MHFSLVGTYNDVQWRGQYINEWPIYRLLSVRKSKEKSYEIFWQVSSKFFEFLISKKRKSHPENITDAMIDN